ncbi:lasso peptide biosynthesis B2 protein [Streptomyces sp. JV176]|uniref:lasso peptide biosynthesis B2 protein n=1 Tax=Streptomyces sp. JV176 TaxID=858630 RepID=UPI002E766601|nr:lasso peptide biosynthesis B2 protein [Streptomyces sp. JV176]MEE1798092.1 lasso peptide biosynthesis B2 protein [Streptomyces sp. JV176]
MTRHGAVHYTQTEHGTAVLDTRAGRGRWRFLDPVSTQLWNLITEGTPVHTGIDAVTGHWAARGIDASRARTDLSRVAAELARAGLPGPATRTPPPTGSPLVLAATTDTGRARDRAAAYTALALALTLQRCAPVRWTLAAARAAARIPGRPATSAQAQILHAAVRHAGRLWPGRAACLEESLGTFLAAAFTGLRVRWVLGAGFVPHSAHAWTETLDGAVVGQDEADRVWPYVPVLSMDSSN